RYSFLLPLILFTLIILFFVLKKTKRSFRELVRYLNLLFLLLIFVDLIYFRYKKVNQHETLLKTLTPCRDCPKPDIYLLVADGYGGRKQLIEKFNFNNNAFEDSLRNRGFYIVDSSISNYSATNTSMSSLLNMRYLGSPSVDVHQEFNKNSFSEYLKSIGYEVKNYSFFKIAGQYPPQEINYFPVGKKLITKHTFLKRLRNDIGHNFLLSNKSGNVFNRFKNKQLVFPNTTLGRDYLTMQQLISETKSKNTTPRFVYCHFLMPHPPYLFDKTGNIVNTNATKEAQYISYLEYTNKRILYAIDQIFAGSASLPVIFLISDHGYRDDDEKLSSDRFLNFKSIYLPDKNYNKYYKGISNVNMFRIFLNNQFQQQLPLLADSVVF
ncbi:MAG: sulfatase-like hydrolase/transferase, partial [Chitinophagaceae bacterium]